MRRWLLVTALAVGGYALVDHDALLPGLFALAGAAAIAYFTVQGRRPTPTPVPTAHAAARSEGRQIVRDAEARARQMVRQAEKQAEKKGRRALVAAQAQLDAEARERWVS